MRYTVIVEKGATSWGAYVPDLSGCMAAGESREEVLRLIREAMEFHLEGLRDGLPLLPEPLEMARWWRFMQHSCTQSGACTRLRLGEQTLFGMASQTKSRRC